MNKRTSIYKLFVLTLCAFVAVSCKHEANELGHHHHHHEEGKNEGMPEEIVLSEDMAERFGVEADSVVPSDFYEIVEVAGQIETSAAGRSVVVAPTAGIVHFNQGIALGMKVAAGRAIASISPSKVSGGDPNKAARAALEAARAEVERLRPLHQSGIVSTREWNSALASLDQAEAAYSASASSGRAVAAGSGVITALNVAEGSYVEAGEPIATVSSQQDLILRADLPERYYSIASSLSSAKIKLPYDGRVLDLSEMSARRISSTDQAVASIPGYLPIYFSFRNDGTAISGGYVQVFLQGSPRPGVITLPVEAISEQQGNFFVYQRLDEDCYRKLLVSLGVSDGSRVEILSGIEPGMNIVTSGTQAIRLAETSAVAPEGHSHNH